ncbi:MAG: hypothetical protein Q4A32_01280 [Lachnospiraceae bacterium]|nr:hypothetical protein [Lachnospiraceae bacterium]
MVRKKIIIAMVCVCILIFYGCGTETSSMVKDTSVAEELAESKEFSKNDNAEIKGESEEKNKNTVSDVGIGESPVVTQESSDPVKEEQTVVEESTLVNPAEPLNMEEDDLSLEELLGQINAPIADVRAFLEIGDDSLEKTGILFGETVNVILKNNEEVLNEIQLSFMGTPIDSLQIAIAEQLGDDGEQVNDGIIWSTEEAFVLLYESAEGCYVDIGSE